MGILHRKPTTSICNSRIDISCLKRNSRLEHSLKNSQLSFWHHAGKGSLGTGCFTSLKALAEPSSSVCTMPEYPIHPASNPTVKLLQHHLIPGFGGQWSPSCQMLFYHLSQKEGAVPWNSLERCPAESMPEQQLHSSISPPRVWKQNWEKCSFCISKAAPPQHTWASLPCRGRCFFLLQGTSLPAL